MAVSALGYYDDFGGRFAFGRERGEKGSGLRVRPRAVHHRSDRIRHLLGVEIAASDEGA